MIVSPSAKSARVGAQILDQGTDFSQKLIDQPDRHSDVPKYKAAAITDPSPQVRAPRVHMQGLHPPPFALVGASSPMSRLVPWALQPVERLTSDLFCGPSSSMQSMGFMREIGAPNVLEVHS